MNSLHLALASLGCILGSFAVRPLAAPLLVGGVVSGMAAEQRRKFEVEYLMPLEQLERAAWLDQQEQQIGYLAAQNDLQMGLEHEQNASQIRSLIGALEAQVVDSQPQPRTIEAAASEVTSPRHYTSAELDWSQAASLNVNSAPVTSSFDDFETVDLAYEIAKQFFNSDSASSVLACCPRRTGKTTLVEAVIRYTHQLSQGRAQINVFNGKEKYVNGVLSTTFCGLANDPKRYMAVESLEATDQMFSRIQQIEEAMRSSTRDYLILNILEELNNIRGQFESRDKLPMDIIKEDYLHPMKLTAQLDAINATRGNAGSSRGVCDLITSHSPYVDDLGINGAMQDNYISVVLGRFTPEGQDFFAAIRKALTGRTRLIDDESVKDRLLRQFDKWYEKNKGRDNRVVALTNLGGWRLIFLPAPQQTISIPTAAPVQSVRSKLAEQSEPVEVEDDEPEQAGDSGDPVQSGLELITSLLPDSPTDADIIRAYEQASRSPAPKDLTERNNLIKYIRDSLGNGEN